MKTLSKLSFLFAVLVFSVFGMIGCNDSGGGDSPPPPKQEPIPVPTPVPVPVPVPVPLPTPTSLKITQSPFMGSVHRGVSDFQEVGRFSISTLGEKNFSTEGKAILTFGGTLGGNVGYVRIMDISGAWVSEQPIFSEHTGAPVVNKKATVVFSTPIIGSKPFFPLLPDKYTAYFSAEVSLVGVDPIALGSFADLTITIETEDDIQFGNNVIVTEFPLRLAVARMETGKLFSAEGSEIVRENLETGVSTVLTFSPQVVERSMVPSRDGAKLAFVAKLSGTSVVNVGIMDADGDGCSVVDSTGCNQAYQIVQAHICHAEERISLFPGNNMVACSGKNYRDASPSRDRNIFLTQISPNLGGQLTQDVYKDFESVVSADGKTAFFLSCRPFDKPEGPFVEYVGGCGIFKREIIDLDKLVFGPIQYVVGGLEWGFLEDGYRSDISFSPDEKQLVFSHSTSINTFVSIVNTDGAGLREVGEGFHPYWSTDGRILYKRSSSPFGRDIILCDSDGSNPRVIRRLYSDGLERESATSVTFTP